jgi:hypothetical protein
MWVLSLVADGLVVVERRISVGTFRIGRDPASDLVLDDALASWSHVVLSNDGERIEVHDDRSTNGTFVDEERVTGPTVLDGDETVRVGSTLLRVRRADLAAEQRWLLVDTATGVRVPLDAETFTVGGAESDDLRIPGAGAAALVLHRRAGEIFLGGSAVPVHESDTLEVGERAFRVQAVDTTRVPTAIQPADVHPYVVTARRNGPHGPQASVESTNGTKYEVASGNRAVLLYLLARRFAEDGERPLAERGWCDEHEVQRGIWGRDGDQNKLDVLLYRLRRELQRAGLDPWFVEKRHRQLRIRPMSATLHGD